MSNNNGTQVIKYLRKKNDDIFESPVWLGSKPCFISPIRNSNLNNLEEQILLGTDNYQITSEDNDGNTLIEQNFCISDGKGVDSNINYYKMKSIIYKDGADYGDFAFIRDELDLSNNVEVYFGDPDNPDYPDPDTVYFADVRFNFDSETNDLQISDSLGGYIKTREDRLYLINGEPNDDKHAILIKTTGIKNMAGILVTYVKIENGLTNNG